MFLKKIRLQNFRGFDDLELSFATENGEARKQTLLLGQNGTGKSNVLKAIAIVTAGGEAVLDLLANPDEWVKYGATEAALTATLCTQKKEERVISLRIPRSQSRQELFKLNEESLQSLDRALAHADRNYFIAGYGASRRQSGQAEFYSSREQFKLSPRAANVLTLFNPNAQLNSLSSWAMSLDYRSNGNQLNVIKTTLDYFLEGVKFHSIDKERKTILFKEGKMLLPLEALSDGYQNMAAWIGDLLFRLSETFNDYKAPLQARGVLLIDELDLHLHPKWQRKLLEFINTKLKHLQVIATTHSPLTAQQADEGELYALKKTNGKIELIPFIGSPKNLLLHQLLLSPVFGLETDESFAVQKQKEKYQELKTKRQRSVKEKTELLSLTQELKTRTIQRSNSLFSSADKKLLREIKQAVKKK